MKIIPELTTIDGVRVAQGSTPKDPIELTKADKEFFCLNINF